MQADLSVPIPRLAGQRWGRLAPGIVLCMLLVLMATLLEHAEQHYLGQAMIGTLVLAILLGVLLRTVITSYSIHYTKLYEWTF